jgi:tetratricopeptide (TPR) repeat protein
MHVFPGVLFVALAGVAVAQDVGRPPTAADRAAISAGGWAATRDALGARLAETYQPGGAGRPGTTGNTAWRQWLGLWKWCDLLTRSEKDCAVALVQPRLRQEPGGQWIFFGSGYLPPEDFPVMDGAAVRARLDDPAWRERFLAEFVPEGFADPADAPIGDRLDPAIVAEWVADAELSRLLFDHLTDADYAPAVLSRLQEIRRAHPAKFREYRALAVALALVYDQNPPAFWPHRQVDPAKVPRVPPDAAALFDFWVQSNESRALLFDLRQLGPGDLKFVVDAPIDPEEFAWARKNVRFSRSEFAKAFSSVVYDSSRITGRNFDWTEDPYTLEEIRSRGGICVDQAYYAMIAGKARGLPTLFFSGQGADGGHAWFGYLKAADRWELDAGRYENQNYAVGEALDPQSWSRISDHDLGFLARRFRDTREFAASQDDLLMARRFEAGGDTARAAKALDSAISVCPENNAAWEARWAFLVRTNAPAQTRKDHLQAALQRFARDRDIRTTQQVRLVAVHREMGNPADANRLEEQIVSSNKRRRADLSVNLVATRIEALVREKNFDQALEEFRRQLRSLSGTGGGTFFYDVVRPLAAALEAAGERARAAAAVREAHKALDPEKNSILDQDFQALLAELEGSNRATKR